MKDRLFFDFSVNKETNSISIQREFAAALALVWDAWTQPEIIDKWWAVPNGSWKQLHQQSSTVMPIKVKWPVGLDRLGPGIHRVLNSL